MEETKNRTRSQGVKYALTPELREYIQKMRVGFGLSTEELSKMIGMKKETYNNIERKQSSTKTITTETLDKLFNAFKELSPTEKLTPIDQYVIGLLDKFMNNADTNYDTLQDQDWLKAYYLKYQTVNINDYTLNVLFDYTPAEEIEQMIVELGANRHIKLKTDITEENEVYINLKNKTNYPDYAGFPFWCIKYNRCTRNDAGRMVNDIYRTGTIKYSLLFALLINQELGERRKKDYNDVYATVYRNLGSKGILSIFDIIENTLKYREEILQEQEQEPTQTANTNNTFSKMLKGLDLEEYPDNAKHLIEHCINGGDNVLNAFDIDLTPLYNASVYDISVFKIRLTEVIDNLFKKK